MQTAGKPDSWSGSTPEVGPVDLSSDDSRKRTGETVRALLAGSNQTTAADVIEHSKPTLTKGHGQGRSIAITGETILNGSPMG